MLNHYSTHQYQLQNMAVAPTLGELTNQVVKLRHLPVSLNSALRQEIGYQTTAHFHGLFFAAQPNSEDKYSFALEEQRARERGLRIWTAHETECVLEVG